MLGHFPTPPPFIDLPPLIDLLLDELRPVDMFGRQAIMEGTQEPKEPLIVAAKDGKRPLVLHLKTRPRPTSPPIRTLVFALMLPTGVDSLDDLGRNVSRPRRLVFHSRHARLDISRHLVWTRLGFGGLLPHLPPLELPLWVTRWAGLAGACWASSATAGAGSSSTPAQEPPALPPRAPAGRGVFGSTARTSVWVRCARDTLALPVYPDNPVQTSCS